MPLPNFMIIGAQKCGTSSLYRALQQHPQIYVSPVKEPHFFSFGPEPLDFAGPGADWPKKRVIKNWDTYLDLFRGATDQVAVGEASTSYIDGCHTEETAERIWQALPQARLIAIVRQPAERAYSGFNFYRQLGWEPLADFAAALRAEPSRIQQNWLIGRYRPPGFYHANLTHYFARFPRDQIRVYLYEDWNAQPLKILRSIFRFLEVDDRFTPDLTIRYNVTRVPRSQALQAFLSQPHPLKSALKLVLPEQLLDAIASRGRRYNSTQPRPLDLKVRRWLTEEFRADILKLADLIGRDLSHWLET